MGMDWVAVVTLVRRLVEWVLLSLLIILDETQEEEKEEKHKIQCYGYSTRDIESYCNIFPV